MKQLVLAFVCLVGAGLALKGQTPTPTSTPTGSHKQKTVRTVPKQPLQKEPQQPNRPAVTAKPAPRRRTAAAPNVVVYSEALNRYQRARHTRFWWKNHFTTIVLVGGGYYYWDAGYWFPAWGYDPNYEAYDYDGPIFTYGNLLPDQVIVNVQRALQERGYYGGGISGALSPATRRAISAFQADEGLEVNGVVDGPTVYALGLI